MGPRTVWPYRRYRRKRIRTGYLKAVTFRGEHGRCAVIDRLSCRVVKVHKVCPPNYPSKLDGFLERNLVGPRMVWPYRRYGRQGIRTGFPESVRFRAEHDQYVTTHRPSYRAVKLYKYGGPITRPRDTGRRKEIR